MPFLKYRGALAATAGGTGTQSTTAWLRESPRRIAVSMKITSMPCSICSCIRGSYSDNQPTSQPTNHQLTSQSTSQPANQTHFEPLRSTGGQLGANRGQTRGEEGANRGQQGANRRPTGGQQGPTGGQQEANRGPTDCQGHAVKSCAPLEQKSTSQYRRCDNVRHSETCLSYQVARALGILDITILLCHIVVTVDGKANTACHKSRLALAVSACSH